MVEKIVAKTHVIAEVIYGMGDDFQAYYRRTDDGGFAPGYPHLIYSKDIVKGYSNLEEWEKTPKAFRPVPPTKNGPRAEKEIENSEKVKEGFKSAGSGFAGIVKSWF